MRILEKPGLTFDDVLLVPRKGYVNSRMSENDIDISTQLTPRSFKLSCPIISANMDTVTGPEMALAMEEMGGVGIIHRFMSPEEQREALLKLHMSKRIGCVGVTESERERIRKFADLCTCVLIDTAHGHSQMMVEQVQWIKESYPYVDIIAGNVCTGDAALALVRAGAACIKVGVGPGSMCTTRLQTGCGVPQLTAIHDVRNSIDKVWSQQRGNPWRPRVIADGGIRYAGDIVKALACGADAVMIGNLLAGCLESPGEHYQTGCVHTVSGPRPDGPWKKKYRGMASRDFQEEWKGEAHHVEGESTDVPFRGAVRDVITSLMEGVMSGMSYQGADSLEDLYENAEFIRVTPAGYKEATAHGLK